MTNRISYRTFGFAFAVLGYFAFLVYLADAEIETFLTVTTWHSLYGFYPYLSGVGTLIGAVLVGLFILSAYFDEVGVRKRI